ncbi:MAG: ECF transporter S component [Tetragenococcus halophilus]|uniref:ECF transporter S component n=1 Tax=Tetragenococcus halophilus TaxID=51669 RepID=UPI001F1B913C|nr:ECF transporter S component [Tetragenococcus halophilus]MCF1676477.1 ECF transporter S component [Tetragenococcus halophilus]MDN6154180.1 ECF transporter S component [Tetragenococcus halophilus]MDN6392036.1 ECF transporter S component [Lactococcus lactis]MDN6599823.1 ECF transporter S component [Tetragenococcus koreensis]
MRKINTRAIVIMALSVTLNIVCSNVILMLRLPIYLDAVGTIFAASLLGPFAGMAVGGATGVIMGVTTDIFSLFFMPVQLITGAIAGVLYKRQQANQIKHSWWLALAISLPGTILSTIITVILFNGITSAGSSIIVQLLYGAGMSQSLAVFLVQVGTDYVDKLLTIIFVSVTGRLIGKRLPVNR